MRLHRHDLAAAIASLLLEASRARRLHALEGVRPEEVKDFGLARQKVVCDAETAHRVQMTVDDSRRDIVGKLCGRVRALFERVQRLDSQLQTLRVFLRVGIAAAVEQTDARVQVPAVVVERVLVRERCVEAAHVFERHAFEMDEADDNVCDLDAWVVNVVVNFRKLAARAEYSDERVADDGVAKVSDVRGLVRIDARVLDHALRADARRGAFDGLRRLRVRQRGEQKRAVVEDVEVARARDLDARDLRDRYEFLPQLFGDCARVPSLARRLLDALRQLEGDGEGEVAELRARRDFRRDLLKLDAELARGCRADALAEALLQFDKIQSVSFL